ncbi:MAG: DsbE family thiol:disulfide interchange protein [Legionellales bacterium]|nr:DsbE family thiol:disulfide interchange protein [Legionellales bacterium]
MTLLSWRMVPLLVFVGIIVFLLRGLSLDPTHLPSAKLNKPLPAFQLPALGDDSLQLTERHLHGQIALLNVWASWCEACKEEHLFLMQLKREGISLFGLNYKDNPDDAQLWLKNYGNPYRRVGEDRMGNVAIDLGVYGAPETFLIDKNGMIRHRHVGILTATTWQNEFVPRISQLEHLR